MSYIPGALHVRRLLPSGVPDKGVVMVTPEVPEVKDPDGITVISGAVPPVDLVNGEATIELPPSLGMDPELVTYSVVLWLEGRTPAEPVTGVRIVSGEVAELWEQTSVVPGPLVPNIQRELEAIRDQALADMQAVIGQAQDAATAADLSAGQAASSASEADEARLGAEAAQAYAEAAQQAALEQAGIATTRAGEAATSAGQAATSAQTATDKAASIPSMPSLAVNVLTNPSGETDVGWSSNNHVTHPAVWDPTVKRSGSRSRRAEKATASGTTILSLYAAGGNAGVNVQPGDKVNILGYLRSLRSDAFGQINLLWRTGPNGTGTGSTVSSPSQSIPAGGWGLVSFEAIVPAGMQSAIVATAVISPSAEVGDQAWADDFAVYVNGRPLVPFNGDTPGCRWVGAPHASASVRSLVGPEDWARVDRTTYGVGSPEGKVVAPVGWTYVDEAAAPSDGGLGAHVWRKRTAPTPPTGWVCVEGDTEWRNITSLCTLHADNVGTIDVRRVNQTVQWRFANALLPAGTGYCAIWGPVPVEFRAPSYVVQRIGRNNSLAHEQCIVTNGSTLAWMAENLPQSGASTIVRPNVGITGFIEYTVAPGVIWPTTAHGLPG